MQLPLACSKTLWGVLALRAVGAIAAWLLTASMFACGSGSLGPIPPPPPVATEDVRFPAISGGFAEGAGAYGYGSLFPIEGGTQQGKGFVQTDPVIDVMSSRFFSGE